MVRCSSRCSSIYRRVSSKTKAVFRSSAGDGGASGVSSSWAESRYNSSTDFHTHHRACSLRGRRSRSAKAARLQWVGPSTAQPSRLAIHRRTCPVSRFRPPNRSQMVSRLPRAPTATKMPASGVSTLAPARPERSVRSSTCRAPKRRVDPSRRVRAIVPDWQNKVSKCR